MSRIRVSNKPGDEGWRDQGGCKPYVIHGLGGSMVVSQEPETMTRAEQAIRKIGLAVAVREGRPKPAVKRSNPHSRAHPCIPNCRLCTNHRGECKLPLPRCNALMLIAKEPCARLLGHRDDHATRTLLDTQAAYRRAYKAQRKYGTAA